MSTYMQISIYVSLLQNSLNYLLRSEFANAYETACTKAVIKTTFYKNESSEIVFSFGFLPPPTASASNPIRAKAEANSLAKP
jgi:hypothetical protein